MIEKFWARFAGVGYVARLFLIFISAALVAVGYAVGGWIGTAVGVGLAFLWNLLAFAGIMGRKVLADLYELRPPRAAAEVEFADACARFAARARVSLPPVLILDAEQPNAVVAGYNAHSHTTAVSNALILRLGPEERSAVAAHVVARLRNDDLAASAWITTTAGVFAEFITQTPAVFESGLAGVIVGALLVGLFLLITWLAQAIEAWVFRRREYRTDRRAAALFGDREAMIRALGSVAGALTTTRWAEPKDNAGVLRQLFFVNPAQSKSRLSYQPPIDERIAALRRAWASKPRLRSSSASA